MTETAVNTSERDPVAEPAPVRTSDRLFSLDVVRGFAVLGILAVNAITFAMPEPVMMNPSLQPGGLEGEAAAAWQTMHVFFQDKMRTLFSMLFGASLFLIGGERSDLTRGKLLRKRLFWLGLFGLAHGLFFWFGDILLLYALTGLVVLLVRSWSAKRLLIVGVALNVTLSALYVGAIALMRMAPPEALADMNWDASPQRIAEMIAEYQGTALETTLTLMGSWVSVVPFMAIGFIPATAALMMIGMGLYKSGFLAGRAPAWVYGLFIALGAGSVWLIHGESSAVIAAGFPMVETLMRPANTFLSPLVSLAYASALILLARFGLKLILTPLARAGQMAFTNYLTQTLIMTTIFYGGRGLGYFGQVGWPEMWMFIIGIWVVQLIWSPLWLSRFTMGPLEWVWRRLTYGKGVALKRA
ncbi:DUF418 domain-containing protein [Brevundimonas sp. BAL450]|uniref:DUF418 domain-containing protein n=2 Tax=Brevundimonas TaxID=41275 RepID=A0A8E0NDH6_9CAUL|nr:MULTISPECIES: DUF418 domain-containing protein [Brevundimonas]MBG7614136.1 DUF418 domain-containing protein [Brevundimonas sp. BAL450]GAD60335.1 hypothetical protein MBEBAB_2585 [Brevundimonas abyssalis TAR-001]